jgi:hypothetical protein
VSDKIDGLVSDLSDAELQALHSRVVAATERRVFVPSAGPQMEAYFSEADILLYGGTPGGGKRLSIDTLVPVPVDVDASGYKRHGELCVGDRVFGADGFEKRVLEVHPIVEAQECYDVEFDTGEVIHADADHNWLTWTRLDRSRQLRGTEEWRENRKARRASRAVKESKNPGVSRSITEINKHREYEIRQPAPNVKTTRQILDTLYRQDGGLNHSVDVVKPVYGAEVDLPVAPYLFGLWLGDGSTGKLEIGMLDSDWNELYKYVPLPRNTRKETSESGRRKQTFTVCSFSELRWASKIGRKHIPAIYMRASYNQRLELLRGLMDTDGTCDVRGQCEFGFSNYELAQGALDLVNSLGIKCTMRVKEMKKESHNTHYRMKFIADVPVFKLQRKLCRQRGVVRETCNRRYIKSVVPRVPTRMNCITVEDNLYCVGSTFIVTHNTGLLIGLALNEHDRTLFVRKQFSDLQGVIDNAKGIIGSSDGFTGGGRPQYTKPDGGVIHFEGMGDNAGIDTGKQGAARDFIAVDEGAQLSESSIRMLLGWNRTTKKGQRCRMVIASNPPLDSTGDWMVDFFAPWLDPAHPKPAKHGELRWFIFNADDKNQEVESGEPVVIDKVTYYPQSRTFIPSSLSDNPFLNKEDYMRRLQVMPEPYRSILLSGNFMLAREDPMNQLIPTEWVRAAVKRWKPQPPEGVGMTSMGVDPAQGGRDQTVVSARYDFWFAPLLVEDGEKTPTGSETAGMIVSKRRNDAQIVVDVGGGYGGAVLLRLRDNGIDVESFNGTSSSSSRTRDGKLQFFNRRSAAWWKMRELLDPDQPQGSPCALPDDPKLISDLTSPTYKVTQRGIQVESKDEIKKRLGRSPDRGDSVVMCYNEGKVKLGYGGKGIMKRFVDNMPRVNMGYSEKRNNHKRC